MRVGERDATAAVFVFGSINADTSYRMVALPAPGETVLAHSAQSSPGGKGANQAIAAAAAGAPARMAGLVGDDAEGAAVLRALADRDVDTASVCTRPGASTGRAVVAVDERGENAIIVLPGANGLVDATAAADAFALPGTLRSGDVLVLQNEVPAVANRAAARLARAAGATVIWNAAPAPATADDIVHDIDLLVVNERELEQLASLLGVGRDSGADGRAALLARTASALAESSGSPLAAVCTLGAAGALYVDGDGTGSVSAPEVQAVDTTAAGDTVVGYLAAHPHLPLAERLTLAGTAGALTVTRAGASSSIPPIAEVEPLLARLAERTPA